MAPRPNTERNQAVIAFIKKNDWSFQLVANYFGIPRNIVAGIMFRHRRKPSNRKGLGYKGCLGHPTYTARYHAAPEDGPTLPSTNRCICQEQHRRGYCTEPGCPFSSTNCTCAALGKKNIPHARNCPAVSPADRNTEAG